MTVTLPRGASPHAPVAAENPGRAPKEDRAAPGPTHAARRMRIVAALRIAFGVMWAIDAFLKWLPSFGQHTLMAALDEASGGQPPLVRGWIGGWMQLISVDPASFGTLLALAETAIAIGLLSGALTTAVCAGGGALALMIWSTGEGFGGPYGDGTTDIGASPVYALVFALLAVVGAGGIWGVDRWLRPRLGPLGWLSSPPSR